MGNTLWQGKTYSILKLLPHGSICMFYNTLRIWNLRLFCDCNNEMRNRGLTAHLLFDGFLDNCFSEEDVYQLSLEPIINR